MLSLVKAAYSVSDTVLELPHDGNALGLSNEEAHLFHKVYGLQCIPRSNRANFYALIKRVIQQLLDRSPIDNAHIYYLVHAHTGMALSAFGHNLLQRLKHELSLGDAIAFGSQGHKCATGLLSLSYIDALLQGHSDPKASAVLIMADTIFTPSMEKISGNCLMGEGVAAVLMSRQPYAHRLIRLAVSVKPDFYRGLWLSQEESKQFSHSYVRWLTEVMEELLKAQGLTWENIQLILPHNVNIVSWRRVATQLQIPIEKIFLHNVSRYAHCFGADNIMNYCDALDQGLLKPGDYYLMVSVGLGATFAAGLFYYS